MSGDATPPQLGGLGTNIEITHYMKGKRKPAKPVFVFKVAHPDAPWRVMPIPVPFTVAGLDKIRRVIDRDMAEYKRDD